MKHTASILGLLLVLAGCQNSSSMTPAPTPPMGWNSWNTFQVKIDEKLIKDTADALVANGMRDAGYVYVNLDDGWSEMSRDSAGNLVGDKTRFPSGMKALGDYLHQRGFKFGIYNCAGTKTCAGYPGGRDHEIQDAKTYASWGVDYLKYDWCNTENMQQAPTYAKMREALCASGRPIVFSICEWGSSMPWIWGPTTGSLWRTTGDIDSNFESVLKIIHEQVGLEKYSGPGHWNDPDMLEVGNGKLTLAESRAHFSMWCMLAAPLIAGNDVRSIKPEVLQILTDRGMISIDQDPLGKQGFRALVREGYEVWAKELSHDNWAICFLNTQNEITKVRFRWSDLPILTPKYRMSYVWNPSFEIETTADFQTDLPPHDVVVFKTTARIAG